MVRGCHVVDQVESLARQQSRSLGRKLLFETTLCNQSGRFGSAAPGVHHRCPKQKNSKVSETNVLIQGLDSQTGKEQLGTGFFVDPITIVPNDHVMRGTYDKLAAHKLDGTYFRIDYVAFTSQQHDICVLRTKEESSHWLSLSATLPLEGEAIVVIGNPKGFTGTISQGIISALRENGVMQITAPVTHGSSGSPVLNMDGHVVAIVDRVHNNDEANLGFSMDLRVLKPDVALSKNTRYGGPFYLAEQTPPPPEPERPFRSNKDRVQCRGPGLGITRAQHGQTEECSFTRNIS